MGDTKDKYVTQFISNDVAYNVFAKLDPSLDKDSNIAIILSLSIKKDPLKSIITYLKTSFVDTYPKAVENLNLIQYNLTKADISLQIVNFMQVTYPYSCLKCTNDYLPYTQDDSAESVECFACRLPAHVPCYKKEDINRDQGIVFLCQTCLQDEGKNIVKVDEAKDKTIQQVDPPDSEDSSESSEESEAHFTVKKKKQRKKKEVKKNSEDSSESCEESEANFTVKNKQRNKKEVKKNEKVCPLLLEGKCQYGLSGKNCEYKHKKMCRRYCSFGTADMNRGGCRFGEDCYYVHPKLCQNSVTMKVCLSESCTYAHLKYTSRKKPNEEYRPQKNTMKPFIQRENRHSNERFSVNQSYKDALNFMSTSRNVESSNVSRNVQVDQNAGMYNVERKNENENNRHFLENALERMQKEIGAQIQRQIEIQFQQLQVPKRYEAEYPALPSQVNPTVKYQRADMFRPQPQW